MNIENADRRDANRILSAALDDPGTLPDRDLDRTLELLESDAKRVRIGAAWVFGIVATDTPGRALSYVSKIVDRLDDTEIGSEVTRALAYIADADPERIERELRSMDEETARRCRAALWGELAERTVVRTPTDDEKADGDAMGRPESDEWGWIGGGRRTEVYDTGSEPDRRRPPTERPVAPSTVDYDYDQYTPVGTIYRDEAVESFKVSYRTPDGGTAPGIFKRFRPPEEGDFESTFDRRIRMWQSIDDHESILPVVDWGTDPVPWVVTAYEDVNGVATLGRNGRPDAAVWTLSNVAESLCFAHRRGVIHGGLTPGSIVRSSIFTEPNAWRLPRVTDWGYVSLLRKTAPLESVSARYLAPEHVDHGSPGVVDGVTDVYGFGIVAYEALVGEPPFGPDSDSEDGLSIPAAIDRRFPEIESFLRRCLADRKPERFQTVEEMMTAFRSATEDADG
ncbi:hypothetical protein KM295_00855 [Natronomonas sp. F2-12]|jgi:serine/threonine protein kinase|uniref:Protein kinase domain-containing protein n=1 Tax=Natronomonas aquatica TaxID=2841590 RepID=A0A9R1CQI0_9EURY|nr:hypothetical protein [Natronomonas aquatica]MCQ4332055.1 hypothetical protein [Natronomonas aquatica]